MRTTSYKSDEQRRYEEYRDDMYGMYASAQRRMGRTPEPCGWPATIEEYKKQRGSK